MHDTYDLAKTSMGGGEEKPAKVIKHIVHRKTKGGGHIFEHHHTHPEHHPMDEHIAQGNDAMVEHMLDHAGDQNPGEAEADAGQSGIVPQGAAPQGGAPAAPMAAMGAQ